MPAIGLSDESCNTAEIVPACPGARVLGWACTVSLLPLTCTDVRFTMLLIVTVKVMTRLDLSEPMKTLPVYVPCPLVVLPDAGMNTLFWSVVTRTVAPETTLRLESSAITVSWALSDPLLLIVVLSMNRTISVTGTMTGSVGEPVPVPVPGVVGAGVVGMGCAGRTTSSVIRFTMPLTVTVSTIVRSVLSDPAETVPVKMPAELVRLVPPVGVKIAFWPAATDTAAPATTFRFASTATTVRTAVSVPVFPIDGLSVRSAKSAADMGAGVGPEMSATCTVVCREMPLATAVIVIVRFDRSDPIDNVPE